MGPLLKKESQESGKRTVAMECSRILINEYGTHQVIFLREIDGARELPIFIGFLEAVGIERKLRKQTSLRPFTHDLFCEGVWRLGGCLLSVRIHDFSNGTYYARIRMEREREIIELDARPSDAIAISLCCRPRLPILVDEMLLASQP